MRLPIDTQATAGSLDAEGNLYVTETTDGSRIQKFVRQ